MTMPWQTTSAGSSPSFDVIERGAHALLLLGERLSAGEREARVAGDERVEQLRRLRAAPRRTLRSVQSPASVSISRASSRGSRPILRGDDVRGFARAQQRAAPQRREAVLGRALGQFGRLRAAGLVERHRQLALEAALEVVGRLAVAGQVDAGRASRRARV